MPKAEQTERVYGGQEAQVRIVERRQRFIEAGIRQFGSVGYHATTVRSLCAEANLAARYFYESFDTMDQVLIGAYQQLMGDFDARLRAAAARTATADEDQRARAALRCFFESVKDPHFARIVLQEVLGVSPAVDAMFMSAMFGLGRFLIDHVAPGLAPAGSKRKDLDAVGFSLIGAIYFAAIAWTGSGYRQSMEAVVNQALLVVLGTSDRIAR